MSDLDDAEAQVTAWLQPLADADAPCGADLEYDNDFLALTQAVAGKPESQFGAAEPPDWRRAVEVATSLFERTRDLRVAIDWLRGQLHLQGYAALLPGLKLINGLLESHWDHVHPLPDPDDGDPYGRFNALTLLREPAGALGDLRDARLVEDRSIGVLLVQQAEVALGLAPSTPGRDEVGREQAQRMVEAALEKQPGLRAQWQEAVVQARRLVAQVNARAGSYDAPDLKPLFVLVNGVAGLLPAEAEVQGSVEANQGTAIDGSRPGNARGLSGAVTSREEAVRAIDLVVAYLEKAEPSNAAPLYLRRARQLIGHNFLQLMKALAPDALAQVARVVGVDPDSVQDPGIGT